MSTAQDILTFSGEYSFYFTLTIFVIGSIGNFINICVLLTLKLFRSNQCAFYLIVESFVNTCLLIIIIPVNVLPVTDAFDPGNVFLAWCKLKNVLPQMLRLVSTSIVCFAAVDQFLSTNPQPLIRQMSTLQLAHRLPFITICIWTIHSIPYAIFYQIIPSSGCVMTNVALTRYYAFFYYPILYGLFPIFVASFSSLLAYRNVRRLIRRQASVVRRRLDRQLTAMIFARVIVFVLLLTPYTTYRIYELNIKVSQADLYPYAIDQLLYSITSLLLDLNYAVRLLSVFDSVKIHKNYYFR
jgi:hypothetical protein